MAKKTCDDMFSEDSFIEKGIPVWKRNQQLPNGMQNDITCVSNEFGDRVRIQFDFVIAEGTIFYF